MVQRHLATKHQIKREQSPSIPYVEPARRAINFDPLIQDPNKMHHAINRNFYSPPWLNQVNHADYNYNKYSYNFQNQYENFINEVEIQEIQPHRDVSTGMS